tara:strand:- start:2297 stop:3112 length:816 start_codon:yes stop_codon:yes gene_type:complete
MKKIKSFDGVMINYDYREKNPNLPVMVFLHGVGVNLTIWNKEVKFFNKKGYSTLTIDLRGHGLSDIPIGEKSYGLRNFAKDVKKVLDIERINDFNFVGHSFGGSVLLDYLITNKNNLPSNAVLIEATYKYPYPKDHELNLNPLIVKLLKFLVGRGWFNSYPNEIDFSDAKKLSWYQNKLYNLPMRTIFYTLHEAELYSKRYRKQIVKDLKKLDLPLLVVAGDSDNILDVSSSKEIHKLIKGSKFILFKGVGHKLPLIRARRLSRTILKFIS